MMDEINESNVIIEIIKIKAYEVLRDSLISEMENDLKKIATEAVTKWAEVRLNSYVEPTMYATNINVQFIEKIVNTQFKDNPIKITVAGKLQ